MRPDRPGKILVGVESCAFRALPEGICDDLLIMLASPETKLNMQALAILRGEVPTRKRSRLFDTPPPKDAFGEIGIRDGGSGLQHRMPSLESMGSLHRNKSPGLPVSHFPDFL